MLALPVLMALALPPLPEVARDDAVVYLHAPLALARLKELGDSAFAPLLPLFLPTADRQKLAAAGGGDLFAAVYRNLETQSLDYWLAIDAGEASADAAALWARDLKLRGYADEAGDDKAGLKTRVWTRKGRSLFLFEGEGRCGLASRQTVALDVASPATKPLAKDPEFLRLASASADAALRGRINIQKYYGYLARTEGGGYLSGLARRLGLDSLGSASFTTRLTGKKRLETEVRLAAPKPWQGMLEALGPAVATEWPAEVPKAALGFVRLSVRPARLWVVIQKLLAQASAMEFTLAAAQLDAIQDEANVHVDDAFGDEPRTWVLYAVGRGAETDLVLVAPVLDAPGLGRILERYARILPNIAPDLKIGVKDGAIGRVITLGFVHRKGDPFLAIAIDTGKEGRVVVSTSGAALDAFASLRGKPKPLEGEPAVLNGAVQDQALALWLYDLGQKPTASAAAALGDVLRRAGLKRKDLESALNSSTFALRPVDEGLGLSIVTTAK